MTSLVTPACRLDRRAVMTEAHRQFRLMRRYGWSFGRCLSFAWAKAREQRATLAHKHVLADTRKMLASLEIQPAEFSARYLDAKGEAREVLNLPKRECLILVSGYSATATLLRPRIASPIL